VKLLTSHKMMRTSMGKHASDAEKLAKPFAL